MFHEIDLIFTFAIMLQKLSIQNYAIIESLDIDFSNNLTIITGETGAGKSIMLGALSLILGKRADANVLLDNAQKCIVEGHFKIQEYSLASFFTENDIDFEIETVIRREIAPTGKSRAFVNDTPVNLTILKELTEQLVDLHRQHETLDIQTQVFQLKTVDAIANQAEDIAEYQKKYQLYKLDKKKLQVLIEENKQANNNLDYIQHQYNELEEAGLQANELEKLEEEQNVLTNAEHIKETLGQLTHYLSESEGALVGQLNGVLSEVRSLQKFSNELEKISKRLESNYYELEDIASELTSIEESTVYDVERLNEVQQRLDIIYKLLKKHQAINISELINIQERLENQLSGFQSSTDQLNELQQKVIKQEKEVLQVAQKLSKQRSEAIPKLENAVNALLQEVGMEGAVLRIDQTIDEQHLSNYGIDKLQFMFAANKGTALQPIHKVASGGELSRLMLCIKSQIAASTALPTLIFDEIDTGISGEVALKVGAILKDLAKAHEVICITHSPQIAGKGDKHYFVYKQQHRDRTSTHIRLLEPIEREEEIAKMLSGEKPTEAALANARELIA